MKKNINIDCKDPFSPGQESWESPLSIIHGSTPSSSWAMIAGLEIQDTVQVRDQALRAWKKRNSSRVH